jgi:hypothetical protein
MMPPPVLFATVILIGWPSLKLLATLLSLPKWRRLKQLHIELKADPSYDVAEHKLIDAQVSEAKGEPLQILMPILTLAGGVDFALSEFFGERKLATKGSEVDIVDLKRELSELRIRLAELDAPGALSRTSALWSDNRFISMENLAFELAMLRYPIASILNVLAILIIAPLIMLAEGLHASWRLVVMKILHSSVYLSRAFGRSVGATW